MISILKSFWHFLKAFVYYKLKGITPSTGFHAMRRLFVLTNGRFNNWFSFFNAIFVGKYSQLKKDQSGVLGHLSNQEIKNIALKIKKDGYYIFDTKLDDTSVESLLKFAENTPVKYLQIPEERDEVTRVKFSDESVIYNRDHIIAPKYVFSMQQLINQPMLQKLIFDPTLLAIAQSYLKSKPILDLIAMWWSAPFDEKGTAEAAQMYHFDLDRFKFLKFFFYLTDVDSDTGPFCYVKSSHHKLPTAICKDRRLTDEEIKQHYSQEHILELLGKKGTIMAVDTRGLHKGKPLLKGERLIFQLEFCNNYFGVEYPKVALPHTLESSQKNMFTEFPEVYSKILTQN
ncbi:phytanoyl-CoA dioxygenase family protein [Microscilla marina]|uniref:Phytanoyl-CoA dioxygenase (PhyH) superfamily n=1 Tax=Microscilla marina ATCC 23134 TaxID=313606 RepID=A1ZCK6_MICM2|nr:phytanoyl-CoA dioxygenase family protein [Microscilla marina]EAY32008.1 hypothetical protein M23134_02037 [Microscilla marina ATCC 23134]